MKYKNILLKYLNTPLTGNEYFMRLAAVCVVAYFVTTIFSFNALSITFLTLAFAFEIIFVRKRLIDMGWSTWWTIICVLQLAIAIPTENEENVLLYIFNGFLILLFFIKSNDLPRKSRK